MIVFDLKCEDNHVFEAWFRSSEAYDLQAKKGQIECPYCGGNNISKSVMAPNIAPKSNRTTPKRADIMPAEFGKDHMVVVSINVPDNAEKMGVNAEDVKRALEHMHEMMKQYRNNVRKECDYVGENFANEARAMHEGEIEKRGIYGEATLEETEDMLNEGIDILPVPGLGKLDS